jgi:hypothetical protein
MGSENLGTSDEEKLSGLMNIKNYMMLYNFIFTEIYASSKKCIFLYGRYSTQSTKFNKYLTYSNLMRGFLVPHVSGTAKSRA